MSVAKFVQKTLRVDEPLTESDDDGIDYAEVREDSLAPGSLTTYDAGISTVKKILIKEAFMNSEETDLTMRNGLRAALDAIKRLGHWQDNPCTDAYVVGAPLQAIIALAGFTTGKGLNSVYYSERFGITFESDKVLQVLVDAIFPWLSDFKIEVDKCPVDRPSPRNCHIFLKHLGEVLAKDAVYLAAPPRDKAPRTADPLVQHLSAYPEFQAAVTAFKNRRAEGETAKPRSQIEELIHLMKERSEQPSNTPPPLVLLTAPTLLTAMPPPPAMLPPPSLQNRGAPVSRIASPMILGSGWTQDELRVYAAPENMLNDLSIETVGLGPRRAPPLFGCIHPSIEALDEAWKDENNGNWYGTTNFRKRYAAFKAYIKTVEGFLSHGGVLSLLFALKKGPKGEVMSFSAFVKLRSDIKAGIAQGKMPTSEDMECVLPVDRLLATSPIRRAMLRPSSASPLQASPLATGLGEALRRFGAGPAPSGPHQHSPDEPHLGLMEHLLSTTQATRLKALVDSELLQELKAWKATTGRNAFITSFKLANPNVKVNATSHLVRAAWDECTAIRRTRFEAIAKLQNSFRQEADKEVKLRGLKRTHDEALP
eukprot:gene17068-23361_t